MQLGTGGLKVQGATWHRRYVSQGWWRCVGTGCRRRRCYKCTTRGLQPTTRWV